MLCYEFSHWLKQRIAYTILLQWVWFVINELYDMNAKMDWSGFEPEASPVQGERYTRFNYQPLKVRGSIQFNYEC